MPERQRLLFEDRSNPQVSKTAPTVSFDLGEPAVSDNSGIAPMPDMRAIERQRRHPMDVMKALPKGLIFDGKSNWFAFKHKLSLYVSQLVSIVYAGVLRGRRLILYHSVGTETCPQL